MSLSAFVDKWQSYGLFTAPTSSLFPSVIGFMFASDRPMISAKSSQISYFVKRSSEEKCRMEGKEDLDSVERYLAAMSR
jgi:hypothetical protein